MTLQTFIRQYIIADAVLIDIRSLLVVVPASMFVMKAIMWGQVENIIAWSLVGIFATLWMSARLK